ncbi:MAG: hypothetical protein ACKV2T_17145 [Kofleriaceae bacterium]
MRTAVGLLALTARCSMGMKVLPSDYDERTIPRCETTTLYPVGDALMTVLLGVTAVVALTTDPPDSAPNGDVALAVGSIMLGLGFGLSATYGFREDSKCQDAIAQWDKRQIEQDELVQERKRERRRAEEKEFPKMKPAKKPDEKVVPRGFFCSTSATTSAAGLCARQKVDCARSRDAASAVVADLTECTLVETAWCAQIAAGDDRCFPAEDVCENGRARLAVEATCREVR